MSSLSEGGRVGTLGLLTLSYMVGEVAHFLPAITSKDLAESLQFGDKRCYSSDRDQGEAECSGLTEETECLSFPGCDWQYSGQGWQYQVLAGPAFIIVFTISGVIMGGLADRVCRPKLLSGAVFVMSLSLMLMGFSTQYWQLVLLRMGVAAGEAAIRPAGGSLIAEMFPSKQRGIANGIFSWGVYLGYGFSFLFGIYLTQLDVAGYGWRATYVLAALPGFSLSLTLVMVRDPRDPGVALTSPPASLPGPVRKMSYGWLAGDRQSDSRTSLTDRQTVTSYTRLVISSLTTPAIITLFLAAAVRHTAGYAWAHNNVSYFQHYHEGKEIGYWFILTAITGGCVGVFAGGYISDLVVTRLGVHSRLWLLGVCTVLATPFSVLTLHLDPPYAFATLIFYYFFAETWFSLVFTVLVEIVPASIRSVCIGTFLFLMNNVGGNVPLLIDPLAKLQGLGLQTALYIFWPGLIASSGVLFFVSSIPLWIKHREHNQAKKIPL